MTTVMRLLYLSITGLEPVIQTGMAASMGGHEEMSIYDFTLAFVGS